jgi:hypothetical protein
MQIPHVVLLLLCTAGIISVRLQRFKRLEGERRKRFLQRVRVALDVPESEW